MSWYFRSSKRSALTISEVLKSLSGSAKYEGRFVFFLFSQNNFSSIKEYIFNPKNLNFSPENPLQLKKKSVGMQKYI